MSRYTTLQELYSHFRDAGFVVCTDTRKIIKGSIFFALKGSNFNANEFASKAIEQGCSFAVIEEEQYQLNQKTLLVPDVLKALQQLARLHREQFNIPVLAITGSNAKTTHKELIQAVLSQKYNTLATAGNLNNHIGVPLTLLNLRKEHEFAIIEMGANHQGEIDELCHIADPEYGLITNIGKAHLEGFGGIEGVKKGKSEMYRYLQKKNGIIFINADDDILNSLAGNNRKFTYGTSPDYDVTGQAIKEGESVTFQFRTKSETAGWSELPVIRTNMTGSYNFINCLAAAAVGHYFKVESYKIKTALEGYVPSMNRSQLVKTASNTLLMDAYNANPNSMKAAIENFASYGAQKKALLLGDMFELGDYSAEEHQKVIELLEENKFDEVCLVGEEFFRLTSRFKKFRKTEECLDYLKAHPLKNYTVLIKGSRGMKMEILQEAL